MLYLHAQKKLFIKIMRFQHHRTLEMTKLKKDRLWGFQEF